MIRKVLALLTPIAAVAALVGCGSDSKSSSTTEAATEASGAGTETTAGDDGAPAGDERVEAVVARTLASAADSGFEFDRDCVAAAVSKLSDADLDLLYEATKDTSPDATTPPLSEEGEALGDSLTACLKDGGGSQALVDEVLAVIEASGSSFDVDCLKTQLPTLSDEQLTALRDAGPASTDPLVAGAVFKLLDCLPASDAAAPDTTG